MVGFKILGALRLWAHTAHLISGCFHGKSRKLLLKMPNRATAQIISTLGRLTKLGTTMPEAAPRFTLVEYQASSRGSNLPCADIETSMNE
mmetsp:Transcript_110223/g.355448  ORF Transcript_110223/g.355448 Transcript_110223/m.355448 type:complete len:90 (+) Transcript_110223:241-510(+)